MFTDERIGLQNEQFGIFTDINNAYFDSDSRDLRNSRVRRSISKQRDALLIIEISMF